MFLILLFFFSFSLIGVVCRNSAYKYLLLPICVICVFLAYHWLVRFFSINKQNSFMIRRWCLKIVLWYHRINTLRTIRHPTPCTLQKRPSPSMISKRQLPVSSIWNSEAHTVRLGDLFQERLQISHTTISKPPDKVLDLNRLHA